MSGDPALGDYVPQAPVNDEARKHNQNLPGQGGVFNTVNLHVYHYVGNNPVKYVDPDGKFLIASASANEYATTYHRGLYPIQYLTTLLVQQGNIIAPMPIATIKMANPGFYVKLENKLDSALRTITSNDRFSTTNLVATTKHIGNGVYQISLQVTKIVNDPETGEIITSSAKGDIAYATFIEVGALIPGQQPDQNKVNEIVNKVFEAMDISVRIKELK